MDLEVAAGLPADLASVVDRHVRAHSLEDLEEPRAARVEVDAVDMEFRTGDERGGDHERRRRREVSRHFDLIEREPVRGRHSDARRANHDASAGRCEHPLGVVTCRRRLDDGRLPVCEEPGEEHGRLHLRARDRQGVVDRAQRSTHDPHWQVTLGGLDKRSHATERLGYPPHRPGRERVVARELERPSLAREDAGQQADERPCVAAVDRPIRSREPAKPPPEDPQRVVAVLVDVDAECPDRGDRRLGVGGAPEARNARLAVAERPDENGAVRDGLVARYGDVPDHARDRLHDDGRLLRRQAGVPPGQARSGHPQLTRRSPARRRRRSPAPRGAAPHAPPRSHPRRAS